MSVAPGRGARASGAPGRDVSSVALPAPAPQPLSQASGPPSPADLAPTRFIDSDSAAVAAFAERAMADAGDEHEAVALLFAAVRDGVRYDPYRMPTEPGYYRASAVLEAGSGYCIQKSVAVTAAARAAGIPSRLGFADVRNHLQSERLRAVMGTDLFLWHGYSTFFVGGRWTKASCAFNSELCARFGVAPLDFDGSRDALLHPFAADGSRYMEYVRERGVYTDLPLEQVLADLLEAYPSVAT
jgi:transglutaminase-like putative cysteine protease